MKNRLLATFLLAFAHCAIAEDSANDIAPGDFAFAVPIHDTGADALYRVVITPAVYQGATFPDLRDLRVFNAAGEVVGLNFDRSWEATINDFAWDHSYSRSIGVDIRYVLWVTWRIGLADRLLAEMGVAP